MSSPIRNTFTIADAARVTGGRIVPVHHNACPALDGQNCTCGTTEYRVVRAPKARAR